MRKKQDVGRMSDRALRYLIHNSLILDVVEAAEQELVARKGFRDQQEDTPCIEWNGFDKPGDY